MEIFNGMITEFFRESRNRCRVCAESSKYTALISFDPAEPALKDLDKLCLSRHKLAISVYLVAADGDKECVYTGIKAIEKSSHGYMVVFSPHGENDSTEVFVYMSKSTLDKIPIRIDGMYAISIRYK